MIDHQTFKDSQSRVQTVGTVIPISGKIVSSSGEGVLSEDRITMRGSKKKAKMAVKNITHLDSDAQRLEKQIA